MEVGTEKPWMPRSRILPRPKGCLDDALRSASGCALPWPILRVKAPMNPQKDSGLPSTPAVDMSGPSTNDPGRTPSSVPYRSPFNSKHPSAHYPEKRNLQHSSSPHGTRPVAPSPIQRFVAEVDGKLEKIETQLSQVYHVRDQPVWKKDDDPRVVDLQIAGCRNVSSMARFRRGLSQRSLTIEFDKWEQATYKKSGIKKRASRSSIEPGRKLGHITKFLEIHKHRIQNYPAVRNGIQHEIKLESKIAVYNNYVKLSN